MTYRLTYWNKRGRGEQVRLLLNELELEYVDHHVDRGDEFRALQAEGPAKLMFGSVPMLTEEDFFLVQGPAILGYLARKHGMLPDSLHLQAKADAIALGAEDLRMQYFRLFGPDAAQAQRAFVEGIWTERWKPRLEGLLEINGDTGFFVGDKITHADIAMWDIFDSLVEWVEGVHFDDRPLLAKFFNGIKDRPRIASYLASDRRAQS
jgi:glutathione S-transferase